MTDTGTNVSRVLKKIGFILLRQGKKHEIWGCGNTQITIPRHRGNLSTGTFHNILKQAGLTLDNYLHLR